MPKLYYSPTSCGAASFIAALNGKVQLNCEQVDAHKKITTGGVDFFTINPKGNVPCLVLDDGTVLNENIAVLNFIADQAGDGSIAPLKGSVPHYLLLNALSYTASEVHTSIGGLLHPNLSEEVRGYLKDKSAQKLLYLENHLIKDKKFLVGDFFTIADSYLFVCLGWTGYAGIDLTPYPQVKTYLDRIAHLEVVKTAEIRMATNPQTVL